MSDDELIAAMAAGDDAALREIFDHHAPWVAARLRRTLPADAVEDVLQETFLAVWRGARSYGASGEPGAWIWGIARRQAALWHRKHPELAPIFEDERLPDPAAAAASRVDLQQALALLGPEGNERRELARMVFVEDRPVAEVAGKLGIPEGTVKSRIYHLRKLLQATLRKGGYEP